MLATVVEEVVAELHAMEEVPMEVEADIGTEVDVEVVGAGMEGVEEGEEDTAVGTREVGEDQEVRATMHLAESKSIQKSGTLERRGTPYFALVTSRKAQTRSILQVSYTGTRK